MKGRVARICTSFIDVPDKVAIAIYFSGCTLRCKDCQNKELWDEKSGKQTTIEEVVGKVKKHPMAEYAVFLGGEPTDQMNFLIKICEQIKNKINLPIALYTGREFEVLPEKLLENLNLIICGPYRSDLHVGGWPASSNQRIFKKLEGMWKC